MGRWAREARHTRHCGSPTSPTPARARQAFTDDSELRAGALYVYRVSARNGAVPELGQPSEHVTARGAMLRPRRNPPRGGSRARATRSCVHPAAP